MLLDDDDDVAVVVILSQKPYIQMFVKIVSATDEMLRLFFLLLAKIGACHTQHLS